MIDCGGHTLWHFSRHNPRYSVAARIPLRNLREGLRDFRAWAPFAFTLKTAKWAALNIAWMLLVGAALAVQ